MRFDTPLIGGRLVKRYKRFLADVELETGETVTAHCTQPGSMMGLVDPGLRVWLSRSDNPKRKLKYSWEIVEVDIGAGPALVGVNTGLPNRLVAEAIEAGAIPELTGYAELKREVRYGENSRIDILLTAEGEPPCYVEVKNVTLMRTPGLVEFPDAVTTRGAKHFRELAQMVGRGNRAVTVFRCAARRCRAFWRRPRHRSGLWRGLRSGARGRCRGGVLRDRTLTPRASTSPSPLRLPASALDSN